MSQPKIWTHSQFTIHEFSELESTNKTAFELAELNKISEKEIILANSQTHGKGRQSRNWSSPRGNLYFSLLLRPKISLEKIPLISFVGIVALRVALEKIFAEREIGTTLENKWPNDLLIGEKKCAGLLLESKINQQNAEFIILGIGLNIDSNPDHTIFPATNLKKFGIEISAELALKKFLDEFQKLYENFLLYGYGAVRQLWLQSAYNLGKKVTVKQGEKEISGIFKDIDREGNLILENEDGLLKINVGDIF
jgi:BirA family biotin operon repressor/biotin-[acetyl-CoA-carboxylase] ligase